MKSNIIKFSLIFFIQFAIFNRSIAQIPTVEVSAKVVRVTNTNNTTTDKIYLRITPVGDTTMASPSYSVKAWQRYKASGYKIERFRQGNSTLEATFTITPNQNALLLKSGDTLNLNGDFRKKLVANASDMIYSALYRPIDSNVALALDNPDVNLYPYVLTCNGADLSFEAAKLAGLGFVDETAVAGISYRYRVTEIATPLGGYIPFKDILITKTFSALPPITAPTGRFGLKYVSLNWRYFNPIATQNYKSFWILRAEGLNLFQLRNEEPVIPSMNTSLISDTTIYVDKLPSFKVMLRYKLIGRTLFDEEMESTEMTGMCVDDNLYSPKITKSDLFGTNVSLAWKFPSDTLLSPKSDYINGFKIYTSPLDSSTLYQPIPINGSVANLLSPNDTTFTIPNITTTTYIKVVAINKLDGQLLSSGSVLVEPIDSTVNKPTNLSAIFNSAGKVTLAWNAPTDNDIIGYKIFRKNVLDPNEEPVVITSTLINALTYLDGGLLKDTTILVNDSTKYALSNRNYVYYVAAVDGHFNQSILSDPAIAKKPDDLAPIQPVIINYTIADKAVSIEYKKSYDEDILNHRLLRYELPNNIQSILNIDSQRDSLTHSYSDNTTEYDKTYAYVLIAKDSANNETMSNLITIQTTKNLKRPTISNFKAVYDSLTNKINLTWEYQILSDFQEYELFRTEDTSAVATIQTKLSLWKLANLNEISAIDDKVTYGKKIQYLIRAAYKDGTISDFSSISLLIKNPLLCKGLAWIYMNAFLKPSSYQLTEACEQVILEEGFGAEATDTGSIEIRTKQ